MTETPGNTCSIEMTSRPRTARLSSCALVSAADRTELSVCTRVVSAVVVMVSARPPICSSIVPSDNCSLAGSVMAVRSAVENPDSSTLTA